MSHMTPDVAHALHALAAASNGQGRAQSFAEACELFRNTPTLWNDDSATPWRAFDNQIGPEALGDLDTDIENWIRKSCEGRATDTKRGAQIPKTRAGTKDTEEDHKTEKQRAPGSDTVSRIRTLAAALKIRPHDIFRDLHPDVCIKPHLLRELRASFAPRPDSPTFAWAAIAKACRAARKEGSGGGDGQKLFSTADIKSAKAALVKEHDSVILEASEQSTLPGRATFRESDYQRRGEKRRLSATGEESRRTPERSKRRFGHHRSPEAGRGDGLDKDRGVAHGVHDLSSPRRPWSFSHDKSTALAGAYDLDNDGMNDGSQTDEPMNDMVNGHGSTIVDQIDEPGNDLQGMQAPLESSGGHEHPSGSMFNDSAYVEMDSFALAVDSSSVAIRSFEENHCEGQDTIATNSAIAEHGADLSSGGVLAALLVGEEPSPADVPAAQSLKPITFTPLRTPPKTSPSHTTNTTKATLAPMDTSMSRQPAAAAADSSTAGPPTKAVDSTCEGMVRSLRPEQWLSASAVAASITCFNPDPAQYRVFESGWLDESKPEECEAKGRNNQQLPQKVLLFPFCVNNNHFVLGIVDLVHHTLELFDSLGSTGTSKALNAITSYARGLSGQNWTRSAPPSLKQPNSHDCGVYVAVRAIMYMHRRECPLTIAAEAWRRAFTSHISSMSSRELEASNVIITLREQTLAVASDQSQPAAADQFGSAKAYSSFCARLSSLAAETQTILGLYKARFSSATARDLINQYEKAKQDVSEKLSQPIRQRFFDEMDGMIRQQQRYMDQIEKPDRDGIVTTVLEADITMYNRHAANALQEANSIALRKLDEMRQALQDGEKLQQEISKMMMKT